MANRMDSIEKGHLGGFGSHQEEWNIARARREEEKSVTEAH